MATPEKGSADKKATFTQAEALEHLTKERAKARTAWTSEGKEVLQETVGDKYEPTNNERFYRAAFLDETRSEAKEMLEKGKSREQVHQFVADRILDSQLERMQAEIEAKANPETKLGKAKALFIEKWRKHPKTRAAIGVGLVVASGGFAAAGLAPLAIGAVGARAAMAGVGGYMGAKAGQEAAGRFLERRKGKDKTSLTLEEAVNMTSDQRVQRMTALLSAGIMEGKGPEDTHGDRATYDILRHAERTDILDQLKSHNEKYRGANIAHAAGLVIDYRITQQHVFERDRLQKDHHLNNRRRKFAIGAAVAAAGLAAFTHKDISASAERIKNIAMPAFKLPESMPQPSADHLHRAADNDWASSGVGEVYTPSDIIMDKVNGDESMMDALQKHLENTQEFKALPSDQDRFKVMQEMIKSKGIESVTRDGESYWRISTPAMQKAIENYQ